MLGKLNTSSCFICISFGVLMWETLARKLPWSWVTCTIKQAICHHQMTLPMLEIWPNYIRSIMAECLHDPADRPCFRTLHECLLAIKNSGDGLTSEVLDGAFPDWFDYQYGVVDEEARRRRKRSQDLPHRSSTCRTSQIYVMLRHSSSQGNGRRRSASVRGGLMDILKAFSFRALNSPREKEIERFGYEIAERLAVVRNIRGVSRNCRRDRWAREVVLTRALEGDIERVTWNGKTATSTKKSSKSSRRGRRYSFFNEESFERLLVTSSKYQRKDWSKVLHGKEKLKNSMEGFKGKVNKELSESRMELLADDDSISEHSIGNEEAGRTVESEETFQGSLALLSVWEDNRATLKPNTNVKVKGALKEITHSKVAIANQSSLYDQLVTTRRKSLLQETGTHLSEVRDLSVTFVCLCNRANDGLDGIVPGNEYEQQRRSSRNVVTQDFNGTFQRRTNFREDLAKLKGGDLSAEAINDVDTSLLNEAELSSSFDLSAKQPERLRTWSLGSTSKEKPLSARESCESRARSARHIRIDSGLALSARRGKSDASAVVSEREGSTLENTALTDTDVGSGRLHRFSVRPDMSQEIHLSSIPLRKLRFGSDEDWTDVAKRNSAGSGERVSSVTCIDWCHLNVSDENEPDMPTGPNSATGHPECDAATEDEEGMSMEKLPSKETSGSDIPSAKSCRKRAESLRNESKVEGRGFTCGSHQRRRHKSRRNEADLSSFYDLSAKQPEGLRTRSLGPTSWEKPLSARESYEPRAKSARHTRIDSALALSTRRGKSDGRAVVSDREGTSLENTALTDTDVGNGRLHRFSVRPDMSREIHLSSTPLRKLRFGSDEDWTGVAKRNSAGSGERVSSVTYIDWCHLDVSDENEPDMPTGPNSSTGSPECDATEDEEGMSMGKLPFKETSGCHIPSAKSCRRRAESLRN